MAHTKIISPSGWDFGRPVVEMVKVSSRGLIGQDRADLIKIASPAFVDLVDRIKIAKDEVPLHMVALGAKEYWGINRNGDAFSRDTCRAHHNTFTKHARFYRDHVNKNPAISYGKIAADCYNEDMQRVEVLALLNGSKQAAERNGGFVADKELQKIARGEDIGVSMACTVPYDVCGHCRKQAATRAEYCDERTCINSVGEKRGGCRNNLTRVYDDGHIQHVDNPKPTWFDMSHVFRPADRTAYAHAADYLEKAASAGVAGNHIGSAQLAEMLGVTAPPELLYKYAEQVGWLSGPQAVQLRMISALSSLEQRTPFNKAAAAACATSPLSPLVTAAPGTRKFAQFAAALADRAIILGPRDFCRAAGKPELSEKLAAVAPVVFQRAAAIPALEQRIAQHDLTDVAAPSSFAQFACKIAADYAFDPGSVQRRAALAALRQQPTMRKRAQENTDITPEIRDLAADYACYKVAAICRAVAAGYDVESLTNFSLTQNQTMIE